MSGNNAAILRAGLERYAEKKYDAIESELIQLCKNTVHTAVQARGWDQRARDFTGNLVNSIVAALFRRGKLVHATYSRDEVPAPIRRKMTYPKVYTFDPAYDGGMVKKFEPEIVTGAQQGPQDALQFARSYKADKNLIFLMVFAYTTEYAKFVEAARATTGYYWATEDIILTAPRIFS